jgi:chromatin assembly factor 1 subunit A
MARVVDTASRITNNPNTGELLAARRQVYPREVRSTDSHLTRRKHDFSDKTIIALSKHIQQELAPDENDEDFVNSASILPLNAIEDVVKALATRVNYGIESSLAKTPAALCVWRWELKQEYLGFLPKASREKVDARLADRIHVGRCKSIIFYINSHQFQYKKDLQAIFDALPTSERNALLGVKGHSASPSKTQPLACASSNEVLSVVDGASENQLSERTTNSGGDENQTIVNKSGRPRAAVDPAKAVEKAAKVGLSISANIMRFMTDCP